MKAFGFRPKLYTALKNYSKELFMADLMAGIIVGIVALPLAIAFGIASGVSPEKGIITAIIAGFIISLMGGSKVQIGGPTGAFIVIIYGIIQQYGESGLIVATLMAGVLLILLGVFKLGAVIKFIPYPIIVGLQAVLPSPSSLRRLPIFRVDVRRRESSGRLCRKMDDLFPTFRYRKLVEHDCKYCQHLHHCHYTAVLEEDSGVTYCHHRGDSGSLADESIWRH